MNTKLQFLLAMLFIVIVGISTVRAQTPTTSSTETSGSAGGFSVRSHGNEEVGGWSFGSGGGSFLSMGEHQSSGTASMEGTVFGSSTRSAQESRTRSGASIRSQAERTEGSKGETRIYGTAFQSNQINIDQGPFLNATIQNSSSGEYSQNTFGDQLLQGQAEAFGGSGISTGPQHMNAWSFNGSHAELVESRPNDDPSAQGGISLEVSRLYTGGGFTLLGAQGNTSYDASGPAEAYGYNGVTSTNYALPFENGMAFGSSISTVSGASSR